MAQLTGKVRIRVPKRAKRGEIIEIRTLVSHPMESGYRRHDRGERVPRHIIERFVCTYNGEVVFSADLHAPIARQTLISPSAPAPRNRVASSFDGKTITGR